MDSIWSNIKDKPIVMAPMSDGIFGPIEKS